MDAQLHPVGGSTAIFTLRTAPIDNIVSQKFQNALLLSRVKYTDGPYGLPKFWIYSLVFQKSTDGPRGLHFVTHFALVFFPKLHRWSLCFALCNAIGPKLGHAKTFRFVGWGLNALQSGKPQGPSVYFTLLSMNDVLITSMEYLPPSSSRPFSLVFECSLRYRLQKRA
ncbi:hypothetical protein Hanom_Chr06g00568801 [Helianthus anomalus]